MNKQSFIVSYMYKVWMQESLMKILCLFKSLLNVFCLQMNCFINKFQKLREKIAFMMSQFGIESTWIKIKIKNSSHLQRKHFSTVKI